MERNWLHRTRHIAVRVNESAFERLQAIADAEQKPPARLFGQRPLVAWRNLLAEFDEYRLARLTAYLRRREPDDNVNFSILVYRLTDADVSRALDGPPPAMGKDVLPLLDEARLSGGQ